MREDVEKRFYNTKTSLQIGRTRLGTAGPPGSNVIIEGNSMANFSHSHSKNITNNFKLLHDRWAWKRKNLHISCYSREKQ